MKNARLILISIIATFAGTLFAQTTPVDYVSAGTGIYPLYDTSTLLPGEACPYPDGEGDNDVTNHDYGGSGSQCVASSTAHAYSASEAIDDAPKGLFRSVLQFDSSSLSASDLTSLSLNLYIINGNRGGFDIYNYVGSAGYFDVSLVYDGWNQGTGTPHDAAATIEDTNITDAYETDPLTNNNLDAMLSEQGSTTLTTLYYDAAVPYADGAVWYSFDISEALENETFIAALEAGGTFSLMLSPTWIDENEDDVNDNEVAFNFTARTQLNADDTVKYRSTGAILSYTQIPEPAGLAIACMVSAALLRRRRK